MDRDQRWPSNIKKWVNEANCDSKRVRIFKKLIHSFERQSGLQKIEENIIKETIPPPLRAKLYTTQSPEIPRIVALHPKTTTDLNSSHHSAISYGVFLSAASDQPSYDSPIHFDESTNFLTALEDFDDESDHDRTYYNISETQKDNFMRNTALSKSYRHNVSSKKANFVRRNSLRSTKREITKKFVVNLYESRMAENKNRNNFVENEKIYHEPLYSVPVKKNKVTNDIEDNNDILSTNEVRSDRLPVKTFDDNFNKEILSRDAHNDNDDNNINNNNINNEEYDYAVLDISASTDSGFSENSSHKNNPDQFPELKRRADVQGHIMKQASSALQALRKKNHHQPAPGELVAEKILLISSYTHEAILQEIRQNQYENTAATGERHTASLSVSGLSFNLENNAINDSYNFYFICICSQGSTVYATEALEVGPGQKSITFRQTFTFDDLDAEFKLKVNVFMLKLKKSYGKFGFNKVRSCCTPPRRVLYKDSYSYNVIETEILSSSFTCCGSLQVQIGDLKKGVWKLDKLPRSSPLTGMTDLKFTITKIDINTNRSGFLTVGTPKNNNIVWNRMWCKIKGHNLKFWNYPSDEHVNPPVITLDMRKILSNPVEFAKRCECPRPRTLHLEVEDEKLTYKTSQASTPLVKSNMQMGYYKMVEYYLSADTQAEIEGWKEKLNTIIKFMKLWNTKEKNTYL